MQIVRVRSCGIAEGPADMAEREEGGVRLEGEGAAGDELGGSAVAVT